MAACTCRSPAAGVIQQFCSLGCPGGREIDGLTLHAGHFDVFSLILSSLPEWDMENELKIILQLESIEFSNPYSPSKHNTPRIWGVFDGFH